ncbi:MAG: hydroxypyruvate isomerase family protein [Betaproteobacteria bacterium]
MPRFAANVSMMYPEFPLLDRIGAAAADGFAAVEVQGPYAASPDDFARALRQAQVQLVLMNAPAGNPDAGDRGIAALPGREREFEDGIQRALDFARATGAPRVHVQAGRPDPELSADEVRGLFVRNLAHACDVFLPHGITVMVEPINTRDIQGYYVTRQLQAVDLIDAVGRPNIALQLALYHLQIMEGDRSVNIERYQPRAAHVQIAGVPQRHEPDVGEINYPALFALLDRLGYGGWVGCEYRPARGAVAGGTSAGLGWLRRA